MKRADGTWGAPAFFTIGGGSVGLQIGGQVVDLVLLVMSQHGVDSMLKSEFTLGGDASLAAAPKADSRDALLGGKYAAPSAAGGFMSALRGYAPPPNKKP